MTRKEAIKAVKELQAVLITDGNSWPISSTETAELVDQRLSGPPADERVYHLHVNFGSVLTIIKALLPNE